MAPSKPILPLGKSAATKPGPRRTPRKRLTKPEHTAPKPATTNTTPEQAPDAHVKATKTHLRAIKTPLKATESPLKASKTSTKSTRITSKSNKTPLKSNNTPTKSTKAPTKSTITPMNVTKTTEAIKTHMKSTLAPSKASRNPSTLSAKPSKSVTTPPKPLTNRFSLDTNESLPLSTKTSPRISKNPHKHKEAASASTRPAREHKVDKNNGDMPPDVLFHKQMTRDKLALLSKSPLSNALSKKQKDAAAEEVFGKGATFDANMLQTRSSQEHQHDTRGESKKERRKLRRKVRELKVSGELPSDEREGTEVGVMYLGHIPHGFYEKEITAYFSQYGEVTRVRVSRSKRTTRSRGFGFVEFADREVAVAAAKSMDGYLMHGQKLVAKLVEKEKVHPDTFRGANRVFKKIPFAAIERRKMIQRAKDPLKLAKRSKSVQKNLKKRQTRLFEKGIHYNFPTVTPAAGQGIGED